MSEGETGVVDVPQRYSRPHRRISVNVAFDNFFFVLGGASTVWLAWLVLTQGFTHGWWQLAFYLIFWIILAYLLLPRLHRILTQLYVPNYFIGRARTSDGLLGDPINLALLGTEEQLHSAMRTAGWVKADKITLASTGRIIMSTILRRSYDEAPVSPLLLFDRQQDVAYQQEVRGNPAKRHHVRFWRCPEGWLLPGGHGADWLAAGTFDRSVGFSLFTLQVTHKIDENTDIERDHIVHTLVSSDPGITENIIRDFSTGYHSRNGGGDTIETDGDLPIIDLGSVEVTAAPDPEPAPVRASTPANDQMTKFVNTPVNELLKDPERTDTPEGKRPLALSLGALLMLFRVGAGFYFLLTTLTGWRGFLKEEVGLPELSAAEMQAAEVLFGGIVVAGVIVVLIYLGLLLLVFFGKNWARITAMSFSSLVIIVEAIDFFNGGPQIVLESNLTGMPLDILILLALSSQSARAYARRPRLSRRQRRAVRRDRGNS